MENPVLKAIADRRSIRGYTAEPVSDAMMNQLMTAAMQSPSARNSQPWHFTVVKDQALIARVNQAACDKLGRKNFDIFYAAPVVIFISADPSSYFNKLDCGIAVQNLALAAHSLGLGTVILGLPLEGFLGEEGEELKKALKFPEKHEFMIALSVGHPATSKDPHPWLPNLIDTID